MSPARVPDTGPCEGRSREWGPGNLGSHCGGLGSSARGAVMWWCEVPVRERGDNHRSNIYEEKRGEGKSYSILRWPLHHSQVAVGLGSPVSGMLRFFSQTRPRLVYSFWCRGGWRVGNLGRLLVAMSVTVAGASLPPRVLVFLHLDLSVTTTLRPKKSRSLLNGLLLFQASR